ncbi:MAG TPA: hypothetical protein VFC65_06880 [Prolixibacteraceae bacterium]|nr:hypothetical protein [Prolixibacteraceae bacterium]
MKKVMILSAAALMFGLAIPEFAEATTVQNENSIMQVKEVQYQEITAADLPEAVGKTIAETFAGYTTDKVFLGDDGTYKVNVTKGEVQEVLFFDAKGALLKTEKPVPEK